MNWKLIFLLSLFGLAMAVGTVFVITSQIEPWCWLLIFIVCASGLSADAMLGMLRARLANPRDVELRTAAEEQAKITRLRLGKLIGELS